MKEIVSQQNSTVKLIKKLASRKHREAEGKYIIEGPNLIDDAIRNSEDIEMIGINSRSIGFVDKLPEHIREKAVCFSLEIFKTLTDTVNPQDVIGVISKSQKSNSKGNNRFVVLDELQDPGNVGTIIRTAEAAGFTGVITARGTVDIYSPKVVRAAAGSLFRINISEYNSKEAALEFLHGRNVQLFGCDGKSKSSYTDVDLKEDIGIVVGNEGNGLSDFFLSNSQTISIPMKDETESLNAAVAASIVIYESVRQNNIQE